MATFNTDFYTATKEARVATGRLGAPNIQSGDVQFAVIPYTLAGTEAAADVINLCLLPAGAIPIPGLSKVVSADPGTTLTMDVGTAADLDGYADGLVLSAGGQIEFGTSSPLPAWNTQTPIVADTGSGNAIVKATVVSAGTLTASTVLTFILAWKLGR
jgi:hypothetical protein